MALPLRHGLHLFVNRIRLAEQGGRSSRLIVGPSRSPAPRDPPARSTPSGLFDSSTPVRLRVRVASTVEYTASYNDSFRPRHLKIWCAGRPSYTPAATANRQGRSGGWLCTLQLASPPRTPMNLRPRSPAESYQVRVLFTHQSQARNGLCTFTSAPLSSMSGPRQTHIVDWMVRINAPNIRRASRLRC